MFKAISKFISGVKRSFNRIDPLLTLNNPATGGIGQNSLLQNPAIFSCVYLISSSIANLGFRVQKNNSGVWQTLEEYNGIDELFSRSFNRSTVPYYGLEYLVYSGLVHGNGYIFIERAGFDGKNYETNIGEPVQLWNLNSRSVIPKLLANGKREYQLFNVYEYNNEKRQNAAVLYDTDVIHYRGLLSDLVGGQSLYHTHYNSVSTSLAADLYAANYYNNYAMPSGAIVVPEGMPDEITDKMRESWDEKHRGAQNAGKTAILYDGMSYVPISNDAEKAQLLESRQFQVKEAARIFRVPLHMLYEETQQSYNSLESKSMEFVTYTLGSHLTKLIQEFNFKLFKWKERNIFRLAANTDKLFALDAKSRMTRYAQGRNMGLWTLNDIAKMENQPLIEGAEGNTRIGPSTMKPLSLDDPTVSVDINTINSLVDSLTRYRPTRADAVNIINSVIPTVSEETVNSIIKMAGLKDE